MAKKSAVDKNNKRKVAINTRKESRKKLALLLLTDIDIEEKFKLMKVLDQTSHSSYIRYRNRCGITGRPRGYRGGVGLSRGALRYYASFGLIAGVKKN